MNVFILGAGFSKAISGEMPLVQDLPAILKPYHWRDELDALLERLNNNVEHLLTYLASDAPFLSEVANLRNRADFLEASRSLGYAIATCEDRAIRDNPDCPAWLTTLVGLWDAAKTVVLTFNYDVLVEKAYESLGPDDDGHQRQRSQLYVMPVAIHQSRTGFAILGGDRRDTLSLHKLHGSYNWLYSGSERFYGETIFYFPGNDGWVPDNYIEESYYKVPDKVPLIVPPTTDKSPFFSNESVRAQWERAAFELEFVPDVYLIGYSLPETDMLVRFLLSGLKRDTRVHLVNRLGRQPGRTDGEVRDEFIARHHAILPIDASWLNADWVRVEEDVLPAFVEAFERGAV